MGSRLEWDGPVLTVDGHRFLVALFREERSDDERFVIWKDRPLLEATIRLVDRLQPRRIVEVGIAEGGSTAFLALYARPEKLVAADISPPHAVLDAFIAREQAPVEVLYHLDQCEPADLDRLVDAIGPEPVDLVIDDASHRLDGTRATFDRLFPLLRPGGVYAIEDWDWAHQPGAEHVEEGAAWWPGGDPLTVLAFELVMATHDRSIVRSVTIDRHLVRVTRGPAKLGDDFRLADVVPPAGARILNPLA